MRRSNLPAAGQTSTNGRTTFRLRWSKPWQRILGIVSLLLPIYLPIYALRPAIGAEQIYLSYGLLERSIPIPSLEAFAETGKVDNQLAAYADRVSPEQLARFRQVLQSQIPLDVVTVSPFLYTPIGERLLDRLGKVI